MSLITVNVRDRIRPWIPKPILSVRQKYLKRQDLHLFQRHLRPSDIFLVGHPKSGNTWMAYMLAIIHNKDYENRITLRNIGDYIPVIHVSDSKIAKYSNLSEPRIFRNESPIYPELYPKTIYLVRDPRASLVSLYHMYVTLFDDRGITLQAFVNEYLLHGCIKRWEPHLERWDSQVLTWMNRTRHDERVIIVKYEDIVSNRVEALKRVVEFAGIHCTEDDLDLVLSRSSFDAMRRNEEEHGAESYPGEKKRLSRFIRRGRIDGWKDEMNNSIIEQIEKEFAPVMEAMGYL